MQQAYPSCLILARTDTSTEAPQRPYQLLEGQVMSIGGVLLGARLTVILRHSSSVMAWVIGTSLLQFGETHERECFWD